LITSDSSIRLFGQALEKGDLYPNLPVVRSGRVLILKQQRVTGSSLDGYLRLLAQLKTTFVQ
jgi:hypothetical protein